jgi:HD-like signal output (HDOD) protein
MFKEKISQVTSINEIREIELELFGMTNEDVSATLFNEWNFGDEMYDTIKNLHTPEEAEDSNKKYAQIIHVVKTLISTHNFEKEPNVEDALKLVEKYGLDKSRFEEALELQFNIATA